MRLGSPPAGWDSAALGTCLCALQVVCSMLAGTPHRVHVCPLVGWQHGLVHVCTAGVMPPTPGSDMLVPTGIGGGFRL